MTYCARSGRRCSSAPAEGISGNFPTRSGRRSARPIFEAQLGDHPASAKPLKGFGSGVLDIRDNFDGNSYRAVYTVRFEGVLYVLHAFQKKSSKGIATPQRHLDLVRKRLREAETIHNAMKGAEPEQEDFAGA